jgi:hypothetical protein
MRTLPAASPAATLALASSFVTSLRGRRAARQEDDRLAGELASYRTEADRAELDAMLSRHSDQESAKVRQLIG